MVASTKINLERQTVNQITACVATPHTLAFGCVVWQLSGCVDGLPGRSLSYATVVCLGCVRMATGRFVAMILEFRYTRVCGAAMHAVGVNQATACYGFYIIRHQDR